MINRVILVGYLGKDPVYRDFNGTGVANLTLATSERVKGKDGQFRETTEWHRASFWGKQADMCRDNLKKGDLVAVEGAIRTRNYEDRSGAKKTSTEIRGDRIQIVQKSGGGSREERIEEMQDDIPW